jgi:type I site-specific restriction endonuclease
LEKDTCQDFVLPRLKAAGWTDDQIQEQFRITDGRILTVGTKHRRGDSLRADYVLEYRPGLPIGVVEAKRQYATPGRGMQQAKRYAQLLDLPFAYSTNGVSIVEDDRATGLENDRLSAFPTPDELWFRYRSWKGIDDDRVADGLLSPYNRALRNPDGGVKEPRYYQRIAINRSVEAILSGDKRLLLTLATGTGKTFVAMQIVWKLWKGGWRPGRNPRVLYLADRNILIDPPGPTTSFPPSARGRSGRCGARPRPVARSTSRCISRWPTAGRIPAGCSASSTLISSTWSSSTSAIGAVPTRGRPGEPSSTTSRRPPSSA